jgi:glycosyltransferase involved in cell wall biosynthesis
MIGIDVRPLQDPVARGVSSYARPLIEEMIRQQRPEAFRFFAAGVRGETSHNFETEVSPQTKHLRLPSKLVNFGMRVLGSPTLDGQLGTNRVFMPNLNFWAVGEQANLTVTVHDLSFLVDPTWYSAKERAWHRAIDVPGLLRRADNIITLSRHTKRELVEMLDIDEGKIHHIAPGVPLSSFPRRRESNDNRSNDRPIELDPRRSLSRATTRDGGDEKTIDEKPFDFPYILFIGALERRKNIAGALAAFAAAAERIPNTHFVLAGAGPSTWPVANGSWYERVHFLGPVTPERKGALLRNASALFLPSFYEGFGFPPLEAMSVGVPVVASSAGALPETIGSAGLLLDPQDTGGFADALVAACTDQELRQILKNRGEERANSFSWSRCADETFRLLAQG